MKSAPTLDWQVHTRHTLKRYDESLLRQVAHNLCKPRNQWPVHELLDRIGTALHNVAMVDRRLKELPVECRRILAVIGRSRQVRWPLGTLVEILVTLGATDGLAPLVTLLESGLLIPELFPLGTDPDQDKSNGRVRLKNITSWLGRSEPMPYLLAPPSVTNRAIGEDLGIECPVVAPTSTTIHEGDGLDWPLRLAVLWQQVLAAPVRRTQQGDFFKRDHERFKSDPLLSGDANDTLAKVPDPGFFAVALATEFGLLTEKDAELHAGEWDAIWKGPLSALLVEIWLALLNVQSWNPESGHALPVGTANPYPSVYLLALLLLARLPEDGWAEPKAIEAWILARHPFWLGKKTDGVGVVPFLLGIAFSLRLVQGAKSDSGYVVRLSPLGRWLLGLNDKAPAMPGFKQTLLVQPNLEILAYRQGLTPDLIANLSKIATWKTLGPACTLLLEPNSVYRALEMGESLTSILQLLEGHGMKTIPTAVLDSLKTWSSKRERIRVYTAGAIFEFGSAAEMNDAIARGVPAVRLTDRLAIVARESDIDYKHFRLTGTRDYNLPPERCVEVDPDGVTLAVDLSRSDLLLDTELQRFAEAIPINPSPMGSPGDSAGIKAIPGRSYYRITPSAIQSARQQGVTLAYLEKWFAQRTGLPISASALLLVTGPEAAPVEFRRQLVVHLANEHLADGLAQWPGTRDLILARLGPTAVVIDEVAVPVLAERLQQIGVHVRMDVTP